MHTGPMCVMLPCCGLLRAQGDFLNEVGSGVGQWVQQQADVLGGVVQKAGDSIKSGKIVSTAHHRQRLRLGDVFVDSSVVC